MDNLTHSLVGALLGQAGLKRKTGLAMPALVVSANLPDIDATCVLYGIRSLEMRRGLTHGPIAWFVLPLILASILWWFDRWQGKRGTRPEGRAPVSFKWLYALALIACLTHPALDWLNVYGIRLLAPFSQRWFYGDTLFIADVWLWAILGFATWFSLRREKRGGNWRFPAQLGLEAALVYIGFNLFLSFEAEAHARATPPFPRGETFIANPPPVAFWRRDVLIGQRNRWSSRSYRFGGQEGPAVPLVELGCAWPDVATLERANPGLKAFLFWSRAPFVMPGPDGKGIAFHDARFYSPLSRGGFSVVLPDVPCRTAKE